MARRVASVEEVRDFLEHFGVKGMQWGVRRNAKQLARARKVRESASPDAHEAGTAYAKVHKSGIHTASNKELQAVIKRRELEKRYSELNPGKFRKGEKVVKAVVATVGTVSSVIAIAGSPAGKAAASAVRKVLSNR